jgi:hypothetical protein
MVDNTDGLQSGASWDELVAQLLEGTAAGEDLTWTTLQEATAAAGVSRSTLRSWYRTRQIPSRLEPGPHGPHRLVPQELVIERALRGRGRLDSGSAGGSDVPAMSVAADAMSPAERSFAELIVTAANEREQRLEARVTALEAELRDTLSRAVTAEAELRLWRDGWRPSAP